MNYIFTIHSLILLILLILAAFHNHKLKLQCCKFQRTAKEVLKAYNNGLSQRIAQSLAFLSVASVEEERLLTRFVVKKGDIIVKSIPYRADDPDDREYKRIHAEEVAEMLNHKP